MDSVRRGAKALESAISICLLAILFLIGVGVFVKQSDFDMSRFGIDIGAAELSAQQMEETKQEQTAISSLVLNGFETLSEIQVYSAGNLYEKINGKAPLYIESGFEKLFTRRFISQGDENLWMELYIFDMANIRNAFSVYSVQKRADVEILPDMQFAYKTSNALYFVHGKYYIELLGSAESTDLFNALQEVAQKISSELVVDKLAKIDELGLFPAENIVAGSYKLYLASAFGFEGMTDIFACRYKSGDESTTVFLSRRPDRQDAQLVAEKYYNFLIENGGEVKPTANKTLSSLKGKVVDFYGTTEIVFAVGQFVAGVHEAENQKAAETLAVKLINRLSGTTKDDRTER